MKANMNFYTANGWAGSNYDSKLSTKEIATKVRAYAKKNFPGFKFSVRSEWSMYTDSLYIEVKEGVCIPFIEGSRSAERGYMSTMNTVKGWEKELTPEMFKVLDTVTTYANSFRYDDSDSMQDYFDTNFYLSIKVSDEYKVIEPKANKNSVKAENVEDAKEVGTVTVEGIEVVDYSEKAIAVFGDTKAIKEQLKEIGGRFNPALNYNGEKRAGWIFSKKQADKVRELLTPSADEIKEEAAGEILETKESAICPLDFDTVFDAYNYAMAHRLDEKPLAVAIPTHSRGMDFLRSLAVNGIRLYAVWSDELDDTATEFVYTTEAGAREAMGKIEENDKAAGVFEPGYYKVIDFTKYCAETECTKAGEAHPLEEITFTEKNNLNGVYYFDIEGAGIITSAKVRADIRPGDIFNVYTDEERKYGVTYDGVSLNRSLYNALPGIIEIDNKIREETLSVSSFYTPMIENVEFYEKKVMGKRYITKDKPKRGYYYVVDTLDNCPVDFYQTREEAEKQAETLNSFTDGNGRLKSAI